jgi:hypothetical protein
MTLLQGDIKKWTLGGAGKTKPIQSQYKAKADPIKTQFQKGRNERNYFPAKD